MMKGLNIYKSAGRMKSMVPSNNPMFVYAVGRLLSS